MAKNESVIGIINALEAMKGFIEYDLPEEIAEEFLKSTLVDQPRPPVRTGALRRSGAVYIGNQLYMTTEDLGEADPFIESLLYPTDQQTGIVETSGAGSRSIVTTPTSSLRSRQVKGSTRVSGTASGTSLRGKISVVYSNPIAALMHEWRGGISDPTGMSGPHFVSSKAVSFRGKTQTRLRSAFNARIARHRR